MRPILLLAALVVAGCAENADRTRMSADSAHSVGAQVTDAPTHQTPSTDTPSVRTPSDTAGTSGDNPAPDETGARLALEGEGLRVVLVPSGSARPIPFGTSQSDAMAMLTRVIGGAPREEGHSEDCAVDYATWADERGGITVRFSRDDFVGWSVGPGSALTTASGIGVGSTRTELLAAYAADISQTTLGTEFSAGALAGVLESNAADAPIRHLWAGVACLAR